MITIIIPSWLAAMFVVMWMVSLFVAYLWIEIVRADKRMKIFKESTK